MKTSNVFFISMMLLLLFMVVSCILLFISGSTIEEVDCFDRFGNKIVGLVCEEEVWGGSDNLLYGLMIFAMPLIIVCLFAWVGFAIFGD